MIVVKSLENISNDNSGLKIDQFINTKQTQSLVDLFNEFDKFSDFKCLYESANQSFTELTTKKVEYFKEQNSEALRAEIHMLKNKYKNLGMDHSAKILDELKASIISSSSQEYKLSIIKRLKESSLISFNFILDQFIG